ncbi:MAG: hypothetical protein GY742_03075 [Hyphomicrobiales bacterium]|nr:hypothetical protein [Hyphomicrobiales bacterium]
MKTEEHHSSPPIVSELPVSHIGNDLGEESLTLADGRTGRTAIIPYLDLKIGR